ncbi:50S ribosomal protein L18 [Rhynchospora pubera]|uniref:50S ribosomal protein L18 n=1 Tax=Rhynchospora pubera TaxID=906938 RepID=A0AAV8D256_9POAL|nr:50S ribosomal protein L18 [Rhynchospora pubera]
MAKGAPISFRLSLYGSLGSSLFTFRRTLLSLLESALSFRCINIVGGKMVIPPPVRPPRIINHLKPYVLRMSFSNNYISTQVMHTPTATIAASASSQEKLLQPSMESTRGVAAAAKIGKLLGERLLLKGIPAVSIFLDREQKYHGKVKAVIDSVRDAGVKLL